jgi:hypothetical protein
MALCRLMSALPILGAPCLGYFVFLVFVPSSKLRNGEPAKRSKPDDLLPVRLSVHECFVIVFLEVQSKSLRTNYWDDVCCNFEQ